MIIKENIADDARHEPYRIHKNMLLALDYNQARLEIKHVRGNHRKEEKIIYH